MYTTFITIHDQELVLTLEKNKVFRNLPRYVYMFVGPRPVDKIKHLKNLLVAREYPQNIEKYKSLCDFTGWYCLVKNNLITTPFVSLIQFDSLVLPSFDKKTTDMLHKHPNALMGYQPHLLSADYFLSDQFCKTMKECVKKYYDVDVQTLVKQAQEKADTQWPGATSIFCSKELLAQYIAWCEPMIDELGNDPMGGHSIERGIKFFSILKGIENYYLPDVLQHIFACSHDQDYMTAEEKAHNRARFERFLAGELSALSCMPGYKKWPYLIFKQHRYPKWMCKLCCLFIWNKKGRRDFREKHQFK